MIGNMDQKTETFLRKRNETLSSISTSLKSIDRSLQRIAATMEKNESIVDALTMIGESYPVSREELMNNETINLLMKAKKEDNDGRAST